MKRVIIVLLLLGLVGSVLASCARLEKRGEKGVKNPVVVMETSMGEIQIELDKSKAPATVENFLQYVNDRFYDGTLFHRVVPGFVIQGGGFDAGMREKPARPAIVNEAKNGLTNEAGTLAMARTPDPDSATAQFFINTANNTRLNHKDDTTQGFGYAVFGRVVKGMDVVKQIEGVKTKTVGEYENVPVTPVVIKSARVVSP